jgi:hypothetical protein
VAAAAAIKIDFASVLPVAYTAIAAPRNERPNDASIALYFSIDVLLLMTSKVLDI